MWMTRTSPWGSSGDDGGKSLLGCRLHHEETEKPCGQPPSVVLAEGIDEGDHPADAGGDFGFLPINFTSRVKSLRSVNPLYTEANRM
jgi:hypothetical protein